MKDSETRLLEDWLHVVESKLSNLESAAVGEGAGDLPEPRNVEETREPV